MHTERTTDDNGVDLPELLARVEYDRDLLREVFEIFKEEFPVLNSTLNDAVAREDCEQIRIAAHTVTGMLANLSFTKATASAMRVSRMARARTIEGIPCEMRRLERNVALAQTELQAVCQEVVR
jgi:two-component system, sensor histidine kinase and response regulator